VTLHINDEVKGHNVRIWKTENPQGCSEPPERANSPDMNKSCSSQSRRAAQIDARITRFSYVRLLLVKLYKRHGVRPAFSVIFARVYAANRCTTASINRDTAQSLGRAGLSFRYVPCDSRSTHWVSVRCFSLSTNSDVKF